MKRITWITLAGLALLAGNAYAGKSMEEREQAQTIVWIVEAASFVTIIVVSLLVWRISARAVAKRKSSRED